MAEPQTPAEALPASEDADKSELRNSLVFNEEASLNQGLLDPSGLATVAFDYGAAHEHIIDIDCGPVVEGEKTIQQMGEEILEYCIRAASGEVIPKAVLLNQDDFIPWKRGVSL